MLTPPLSSSLDFTIMGLSLALYVIIFYLNRQNHIRLAAHLLCYAFTGVIVFYISRNVLTHSTSWIFFLFILSLNIPLSGIMINSRIVFVAVLVNSIVIFISFLLTEYDPYLSILPIGFSLLLAIISWLYQRSLEQSQKQLIRSVLEKEKIVQNERLRISQGLHDSTAQTLWALKIKTDLLQERSSESDIKSGLDKIRSELGEAIKEIRQSIHSLRPTRSFFSLDKIVADFEQEYRSKVQLQINGYRQYRIVPFLEHTSALIVQEALTNIGKHAQATEIWVEINITSENISISVQDDGHGFDQKRLRQAVAEGHIGLKQMRERVEQTGGSFSLKSKPGEGTTLQVSLIRSKKNYSEISE